MDLNLPIVSRCAGIDHWNVSSYWDPVKEITSFAVIKSTDENIERCEKWERTVEQICMIGLQMKEWINFLKVFFEHNNFLSSDIVPAKAELSI